MLVRYGLWLVGWIALALGIAGIFLPVLPTTPFVLLAAVCWAKASPKFHRWLVSHPYFGGIVRNWEKNRAIPRRAKYLAFVMMTASCLLLFWRLPAFWYVWLPVALVCLSVGIWMWKKPEY